MFDQKATSFYTRSGRGIGSPSKTGLLTTTYRQKAENACFRLQPLQHSHCTLQHQAAARNRISVNGAGQNEKAIAKKHILDSKHDSDSSSQFPLSLMACGNVD